MPHTRSRLLACAGLAVVLVGLHPLVLKSQNTPADKAGGLAQILTADDVRAVLTTAASALNNSTLAAAVVDRTGQILGVYARPNAGDLNPDTAVTVARGGALFANDQAPLSSRTVRFISGTHFPPGIPNTPNAELYGVELINRGCQVNSVFNAPFPRPVGIAGAFGQGAGGTPLPCRTGNLRGCARGGPILDDNGTPIQNVGITTGKPDVFDTGQNKPGQVPVNGGGIPIYRGGKVIGGVGVAGVAPNLAEYAATLAAAGSGRGMDFSEPLGTPGAVLIDGVRLPFFGTCTNIPCIRRTLQTQPAGSAPGSFSDGTIIAGPRDGFQAPEGYIIGPKGPDQPRAGSLTADDVRRLIDQSVAAAFQTRAMIRLPINQPARMTISIADEAGDILALYRMPDGTVFSSDVAMTKARNAYYFSTPEGYRDLRQVVDTNPYERYTWTPDPPPGKGWAVTARTLSFGGQPIFPPGIDLERKAVPGPFFPLFVFDSKNACTMGPSFGPNSTNTNLSGILWFPGSTPLYRGDQLIGGLGVSGDGVSQDDIVSQLGSIGFHPPDALRVDNSIIRNPKGEQVRLPYLKLPRNPSIQK